jgi:hypothetical protein
MSSKRAHRVRSLNKRFAKRCRYHSIQKAVFDAHNNDFIVVMPGIYSEAHSRKQPTQDPKCQKYLTDTDFGGGGPVGVSYRYQWHCPNDQALINVLGRKPGKGAPPPPQADRHGIPDLGRCVRCNLQIQGSGPRPEDVVIDSGKVSAGNGGPSGVGSKKDVALKADRADGFVLKNVTVRHAIEHDVYVLETDGYLLDRDKFFYAGEYGSLMFASDHGLTENCEAVGNGDSGVYPGGAPETEDDTAPNAPDKRDTAFYPKARLNQKITRCDIHHNNMATSGTMGNAVHIVHNNMYDNAAGIVTDSFYAGGHPGFPQSGAVFEKNNVYSNNFNDYAQQPKRTRVKSTVGVPLGTGVLIAGGNSDVVRGNHIYDNWRRGAMLIAVPDAVSCAPTPGAGSPPCTPQGAATTSNRNSYRGNMMGRTPAGVAIPNGVDFWWDEFPGNTGNCWYPNTGSAGTAASITSDPAPPPVAGTTVPGYLPQDCGSSANVGRGNAAKEAMLLDCAANGNDGVCEWYQPPARPGSAEAKQQQAEQQQAAESLVGTPAPQPRCELLGALGTLTCQPPMPAGPTPAATAPTL